MVKLSQLRWMALILIASSQLSLIAIEPVRVTLDRNEVRVNETFEMTVHMDAAPTTQPAINGMPADLEVLRNSNFYTKRTVNGEASVQAGWRFTIKALNEGIFTIPAFEVDGKMTQPVTLKVLEAVNSTTVDGQPDAIRITAELNQDEVYVQQQLAYTIRLYRAVQAQYASLTEPTLEGALIEVLGDDVQFETNIDGVRYRVLERRYAIFPQQSGEFTISGVTYNAEVSTGRRQFSTLGSLRSRSRSVSLSTEDKTIKVKPIPSGVTDWWLPASNIRLQQSWQPATTEMEVGTPVTWTYTIEADGLTSTQIPDQLPENIPGVKFYPEQPKASNTVIDGQMIGKRTQTIAVIATEPGEITIPSMTLNWWDINTDEPRQLILPVRTLTVKGDPTEQKNTPSAPEVQETDLPPITTDEVETLESNSGQTVNWLEVRVWQTATLVMALFWIATLLWKRRDTATQVTKHKASETTQPIQEISTAMLLKSISEANLPKLHHQLLSYAKQFQADIRSIQDIIRRLDNEALINALHNIDASRYGQQEQWSLNKQQLNELEAELRKPNNDQKNNEHKLMPLYPEHS